MRARGVEAFVDIGTGGGFPGIPIAAALPAGDAVLLESIGKKVDFVETVIHATGLDGRVRGVRARAEDFAEDPAAHERWAAVVARAVAGLADLVELGFPLLQPGGSLVAWKRGDIAPEIESARRAVEALGGGDIETIDTGSSFLPGHVLVFVRKDRSTPAGWPRDPAQRRRNPW